jgi:hypothetical protein
VSDRSATVLAEVTSIAHPDDLPMLDRAHRRVDAVPTLLVFGKREKLPDELGEITDRDHVLAIPIWAWFIGPQSLDQLHSGEMGKVPHTRLLHQWAAMHKGGVPA